MTENPILVGALKKCKTRNDIDDVFSRFDISSDEDKESLLLSAMGNPKMFYSNGSPSSEQKCELALQMFLTMNWKYAEMIKAVKQGMPQ